MNLFMKTRTSRIAQVVLIVALAGCGGEEPAADKSQQQSRATVITVTEVASRTVEEVETTVGSIRSKIDPTVSAEVGGQVVEVNVEVGDRVEAGQELARLDAEDYRLALRAAEADIGRLKAMIDQQQRTLQRFQTLVEDNYVSESRLDEVQTQLESTREQLRAAQAQAQRARRNLERTSIKAPVAATIEERMVSVGDFVGAGSPLFRLSTDAMLRVVLPFPEGLADRLAVGQLARLSLPTRPDTVVEAEITELRPDINAQSGAIEAIVELANPGGWRPGASVTAQVVLERRENAVTVPALAVVRRPAGTVVYEVEGDRVHERKVRTGVRTDKFIEILDGLSPQARVAVDGAAYLTDGATVRIKGEQAG